VLDCTVARTIAPNINGMPIARSVPSALIVSQ